MDYDEESECRCLAECPGFVLSAGVELVEKDDAGDVDCSECERELEVEGGMENGRVDGYRAKEL